MRQISLRPLRRNGLVCVWQSRIAACLVVIFSKVLLLDALPQVQEEDISKHLFAAHDETTYPVHEYLIHLAPEEDYTKEEGVEYEHHHDHVQPFFLREADKPRVVNFYSPFCGHCLRYRPKYIELARQVNQRAMISTAESSATLSKSLLKAPEQSNAEDPPIPFYAVSCSEFHKVCQTNNVKGYPTIVAYPIGSLAGTVLQTLTPETVAEALHISLKPKAEIDSPEYELQNDERLGRNRDHDALGMVYTLQKHTHKDTFFDAALSFSHGLKNFVFPAEAPLKRLDPERKKVLSEWIDLLYWALPPTWRLHIILHDIRSHYSEAFSSRKKLIQIVDHHHDVVHERDDNKKWTKSCRKPAQRAAGTIGQQKYKEWLLGTTDTQKVRELAHENGHLCGFWNLLHIVSVGVSERHKAVLGDRERISTAYAARTIRNYIEWFLPSCPVCQQHYIQLYDSCAFNLCRRLKQPKQHTTYKNNHPRVQSHDSWQELALWIWQVHNDVNVKLLREEYTARANAAGILSSQAVVGNTLPQQQRSEPTVEEENAVRWPSTAACPYCWLDNQGSGPNAGKSGTAAFNRTAVYQHLKEIYWPRGPQHFKYVVLDKVERSKVHKLTLREELELFLVTQPIKASVLLIASYISYWLYKRWKRTLSGWHKKYDKEFDDS